MQLASIVQAVNFRSMGLALNMTTVVVGTSLLLFATRTNAIAQTVGDPYTRACLDSCMEAETAGDHERAINHVDRAYDRALAGRDTLQQAALLVRRGEVRQRRGDYNGALSDLFAALRLFESLKDENGLAKVYNNIGSVHHYDKNYTKAGGYYAQSLAIRERQGTPAQRAQLYNNYGALLQDRGLPDSALLFHRRGLAIRLTERDTSWMAVTYAHIGSCFDKLGRTDSALYYLQASLALIERLGDRFMQANVQAWLGLAHLRAGHIAEALTWCGAGRVLAEELYTLPVMERCYDCLYQAHGKAGNTAQALLMLQRYMAVRDSMFGQERAKELTRIELTHTFERQRFADSLLQVEEQRRTDQAYQQRIRKEREQKRFLLYGGIGVLLLAGGLWSRLRYMRRSRNTIQMERERSDRLLLNILPRPIAEELKEHGRAKARDVSGVSILFTDFHNFTALSEVMGAQELVGEIDTCFKAFDAITVRHRLEKIKTIGDAYMCAGGLPEPQSDSALRTVLAALEMQDWMIRHAAERTAAGLPAFRMRAGIHTGPVVAGIVGDTKFQYDIWGDTVNIAARMESNCEVGRVNISESTFALVGLTAGLAFTPRGRLHVKGKGEMEMYFVQLTMTPIGNDLSAPVERP